jgi:hypothetical protein
MPWMSASGLWCRVDLYVLADTLSWMAFREGTV